MTDSIWDAPTEAPVVEAPVPKEPTLPEPKVSLPGDEIEPVPGQETMFGADEQFTIAGQEWQGMPEYVSGNLTPWRSILVHFESWNDMQVFATVVDQPITMKTKSIWYPEQEQFHFIDKRWASEVDEQERIDEATQALIDHFGEPEVAP